MKERDEIELLTLEAEAYNQTIKNQAQELKKQQDDCQSIVNKLNKARTREIAKTIRDIAQIYVSLEEPFATLKAKVLEIKDSDPQWFQIPAAMKMDPAICQLCANDLRAEKVKSLELLIFLQKALTYDRSSHNDLFVSGDCGAKTSNSEEVKNNVKK